jgi:fatty acid CoA ligase FadD36
VLGVLGPLRVGSRLTHTVRPSPAAYATAGGTMYFGVPTVWSRICAEPGAARALRSARLLVSGSAPLPVPVFDQLVELTGLAPVERYGMTETLITLSTRADGERRPGWVGVPIDGVETRHVGDDGQMAPCDGETVGHLQVRGATLFDGYLSGGRESDFVGGWFVTGDSVVVDDVGFHRIVGRTSIDIIKTGGYKVGAGEVETALLGHPGVLEAAVVGLPDADLGQRVVAYVVAEGATADEIDAFVAGALTTHKRPREIRLVGALPRNAMGKVQKSKLT